MKKYDAVVIGGGFAGAATAWWLRHSGATEVLILEQEEVPGAHASGKNAGIARQAAESASTTTLCARGTAFISAPLENFCETRLMEPTGGFLLANRPSDHALLEEFQRRALAAGADAYPVERFQALAACPILDGAPFTKALFTPGDGLVDIHALLAGYLQGITLQTGERVKGFEVSGHRVRAVLTAKGNYSSEWVVLAAGAWAGELAAAAGAVDAGLQTRRRHLVHTGPMAGVSPRTPYAWSIDPPVYVRPESGGWLLSPCDEESFPACSPPADPEAPAWLARRLKAALPALANIPVARTWAELRTFSADGDFVVGADPTLWNMCWVAGLCGHGMTASSAVGELAAALITQTVPPVDPAPFDPKRFS